jgi:hypothetical protein
MGLKRYTRDELITILDDMLWEEIATSNKRWECDNVVITEGKSIPRQGMEQRLNNLKVFRERKKDYYKKCQEKGISSDNKIIFTRAQYLIGKLICMEENGNSATQRKYYERDRNLFLSRSYIEFPLDKKLNALYDDFSGVFLMFEDVATLANNRAAVIENYGDDSDAYIPYAENHIKEEDKRKEFLSLKSTKERVDWAKEYWGPNAVDVFDALPTKEEKIAYLKEHAEVTHRLLGGTTIPSAGIAVTGDYSRAFTNFDSKQAILPEEFCDFNKPTLADSLKIQNNDLLQWVQSKIDIDKENLKILSEVNIRGDVYKLEKTPGPFRVRGVRGEANYMIRYVCPSTGRVYHNLINEETLRNSRYYKKDDYTSYLLAWWHITHCGEDPTDELEVIRV